METTDVGLRNFFERQFWDYDEHQVLVKAEIYKDGKGRSRGFGFVQIFVARGVDIDVEELVIRKTHVIDGKEVECKRAIQREDEDLREKKRQKQLKLLEE